MNKEKKEKLLADEFAAGLLKSEVPEKSEEVLDSELFGKELFEKNAPEEEKEPPDGADIFDCGKGIRIPEEAVAAFAKAAGKSVGEVIEIYQKGCCFDELARRCKAAEKDSDAFEKIAGIRGIEKEELKEEILSVIEKARFEKAVALIEEENPGIAKEVAEELAKFRLGEKGNEPQKNERHEKEKRLVEKIRELDLFAEKHSPEGVKTLDRSIVDEWEKGLPLEKAFYNYLLISENKKLLEEIENMKKGRAIEDQKVYAKAHSPGSVSSPAGNAKLDEFIEGLFKEY